MQAGSLLPALVSLLTLVVPASADAQTVAPVTERILLWENLHVGMSPNEVVQALRARGIKTSRRLAEGIDVVSVEQSVKLWGVKGSVGLGFNRTGLAQVEFQPEPREGAFFDKLMREVAAGYGPALWQDHEVIRVNPVTGSRSYISEVRFVRAPVQLTLDYYVSCTPPRRQFNLHQATVLIEPSSRARPRRPWPATQPTQASC